MPNYAARHVRPFPRLPLKGSLDLTYRCNFDCCHCWLRMPQGARQRGEELSFDEIRGIVEESRSMGCREWTLSGGEPMLRPEFTEIFDYITRRAARYSLNTNGSLITPEIARLMPRKGNKMVALYGATAEIHDHVTRTPGAFELAMRGFAYLKEAGAGFVVQLIPMRANFHQWAAMVELAESLSPHWRVGATWLCLSAERMPERNAEIAAERLEPRQLIDLDCPNLAHEERLRELHFCGPIPGKEPTDAAVEGLFAQCIAKRRDFHIDPYGRMTFCSYIKDPAMRFNLREGTFREAWEEFIPSLAGRAHVTEEYRVNCGSCEYRADCHWCAAYAYLETGRYSAPIPHLCEIASQAREFKKAWQDKHRRYFQVAGITVRVESDLDFNEVEFKPEFAGFRVSGPGADNVTFRHYFELPDIEGKDLGEELYRKVPWAISLKNDTWYYRGISPDPDDTQLHRVAVFNAEHTHATIYSPARDQARVRETGFQSLSLLPTDQIWLAPVLADRSAILIHSAAVILNGQGLLFVGHAEAGKSTTVMMLMESCKASKTISASVEILCDDRNIVRRWHDGWRVHGTWSHGDVPDVSPAAAPLRAVLFLQQALNNELVPMADRKEIWCRLFAAAIKPMVTAAWWSKEMDVLDQIVKDVPCFMMRFDKSGDIVQALVDLSMTGMAE